MVRGPTLPPFDLDAFLRQALAEDVGDGDLTTRHTVPAGLRARGLLRVREAGVVSGLHAALRTFQLLEPDARVEAVVPDGGTITAGGVAGTVDAGAATLVTGERLALNLLGRLSGVATLTRRYADALAGTGVHVVDTRKTTPLLRALEKRAVVDGGGRNHRFGLFDQVLVKDNHLALAGAAGSAERVATLTRALRAAVGEDVFVQVEATTTDEAVAAARSGADSVLFDNFRPGPLKQAVAAVRAAGATRPLVLEASGGITLETIRDYAGAGVDRISVGALTHGARSLDVTLDIELEPTV